MKEKWKSTGKDSDYEVSNLGRLRRGGRLLNPSIRSSGYRCHSIHGSQHSIHRLVAIAFIPNINNKPQVNHKDLNKLNNAFSNLEWVTPKENSRHAYDAGVYPPNSYYPFMDLKGCEESIAAKLTNEKVREIKYLLLKNNTCASIAKTYNVTEGTIAFINNGTTWKEITVEFEGSVVSIPNVSFKCSRVERLCGGDSRIYESAVVAGAENNVRPAQIRKAASGIQHTAGGYGWKYV